MVPVGGAVVAGFDKQFIDKVCENYPGKKANNYLTAKHILLPDNLHYVSNMHSIIIII